MYALPLIIGFAIDILMGDPYNFPSPVKLLSNFISGMEIKLRQKQGDEQKSGKSLAAIVLAVSFILPLLLLILLYKLNAALGVIIEGILLYFLISPKCVYDEIQNIYGSLQEGNVEKARRGVSLIASRDTADLDEKGIIRAAVETAAENTSSKVCAPMFYFMIGGAPLAFLYKAANTMKTMFGSNNEKYAEFGKAAVKADSVLGSISGAVTSLIMIASSHLLKLDGKKAESIWKRDGKNNAVSQTEAAAAGALGVQLGGDVYYFGQLCERPYVGDDEREIESEDIKRTGKLMYVTAALALAAFVIVRGALFGVLGLIFKF